MSNIDILEFNLIRENLANYAKMEINKELLLNLEMTSNKAEIKLMLDKLDEFARILVRYGNIELVDIGDIEYSVNRASKGSVLTIPELYNILSSLRLISELEKYSLNISREEFIEYYKIFDSLEYIDTLFRELFKCIGPDLTILDNASLKLKKIRNEINNAESDIKNKLNKIIASNSRILADTNIVYRNGRQLLAVIASYKYSLGGVIVDESSSGATVYVEPEEVYKLTSKINLLKEEEKEEIERILVYLSQYVVSYKDEVLTNFYSLLEMDLLFAKAKYGNRLNAKCAKIGEEIRLVKARHPLIDQNKVVSNNFVFEKGKEKIIAISGPNTGGKSVALKTLGLLAYMNQCGLMVSVDGEAILPIFDNIYLDLGDNQSIASSLSTFSSHISNLVSILNNCSCNSLVLLDEVGAGTDPKQGEALAIALLEEFHDKNCYLMTTTHYDNVKSYALESNYIKICAMEFNTETLKPTYKLIENSIGKSYGFEIAKLYGVSEKVINKALDYKEKYSNVNEKALQKLQEEIDKYERMQLETEKLEKSLEDEIAYNKQKNDNLNALIQDISNKAEEEKERLIEESVNKIEEILESIKNKEDLKMHEALIAKKALEDLETKKEEEKSLAVFSVGDYVFVNSLSLFGTITKKNKDLYTVNVGKMNIEVKNKDLEKRSKNKDKVKVNISSKVKTTNMRTELNLIGKTSSEALFELEKFLDRARVVNLSPVRIIHGFGKGVLRETVSNYLKKCSFVESYSLAGYGQGSGGATIVYLKKRNEQ